VFGARAPALALVRAGLWLRQTRLGQLLDATVHFIRQGNRPLPEWSGMEMMAEQKVRYDSPATETVYRNFERNLRDILATCARTGVPIVVCTVATNLKDCAPFASLHRAGLTAQELTQWQAAYDAGIASQKKGRSSDALKSFENASRIDNEFAELAFGRGQCSSLLGQDAAASSFFSQARDQDALQFRADGRINELIRQAATDFSSRRATLVDAEQIFATNSPHGLTGAEYFYEHVHLTPEGNYLLARAVAEQAATALSLQPNGQWILPEECLRLLGFTDWNRYDDWNVIQDRIQRPPFTTQVDHTVQMQRIDEQLARYRLATKPAQVKREVGQVLQVVEKYPNDPDLRWNLAALLESAGDNTAAEEQWRAVLKLQPRSALAAFNLAKLLDRLERRAEAVPLYMQCLRIDPEYYPARYALGSLLLKMDRLAQAIEQLRHAVWQKPASIEARLALGQAFVQAQRPVQARQQLQEILRLDPNNAPARAQLEAINSPAD
jgi:tetratricopeptide (TPR) repeat protein